MAYNIPDDNPFVGQEATSLPEIWAYGSRGMLVSVPDLAAAMEAGKLS